MLKKIYSPLISLSLLAFAGWISRPATAQSPPNYLCYFVTDSGRVVNLNSICGERDAIDAAQNQQQNPQQSLNTRSSDALALEGVQISRAGITGQLVNQTGAPLQVGGLTYQIVSQDGTPVLTGIIAVEAGLNPGEPIQFLDEFSDEDRQLLAQYAADGLQLALSADANLEGADLGTEGLDSETEGLDSEDDRFNGGIDGGLGDDIAPSEFGIDESPTATDAEEEDSAEDDLEGIGQDESVVDLDEESVINLNDGAAFDEGDDLENSEDAIFETAPDAEEDTADFGDTRGELGNTGDRFGDTGGSFGDTGGDFGDTGGSFGETGGSFGDTGGDFGDTGGSFGDTGGDFGETGGDFGDTGTPAE